MTSAGDWLMVRNGARTPLDRIPRRFIDRLRSLLTPLRRYRCVALTCHWEGTIEDRHVALPAHAEKKRYERRIDAP